MFFDEALAELGIDLNTSVEDARRAYLRLLKTRKPEVDREGFMRLREAYERVRAELPLYQAIRKAQEVTPVQYPDNPAAPEEPRSEANEADTRAGTHVPWLERLEPTEEPRPPAPPPPPAPTVADEPKAKVADEPKPAVLSVEELILQGKVKTAGKRARRLYREATQRGEDKGELPTARTTLRLLLRLHQVGYMDEADSLQKEFVAWLNTTGLEARIITGDLAVLWSVARELSALPASFPSEMRAAIAVAALDGDLADAQRRALDFRTDQPLLARAAAIDLREHTTALASLANLLDPPSSRPSVANGWGRGSYWFVVPVLLGLMRLLPLLFQSSARPSYPSYTPPSFKVPAIPTSHQLDGGAPSIWDFVDASGLGLESSEEEAKILRVTEELKGEILKLAGPETDKSGRATDLRWTARRTEHLATAVTGRNCAEIERLMKLILAEIKQHHLERLMPKARELGGLLRAYCHPSDATDAGPDGGKTKP